MPESNLRDTLDSYTVNAHSEFVLKCTKSRQSSDHNLRQLLVDFRSDLARL